MWKLATALVAAVALYFKYTANLPEIE